MTAWVIAIVILLMLAAFASLLAAKKKQAGGDSNGFPYHLAGALFSPAERSFLGVLDRAVGADYRVFGKVRIADVANLQPGLSNSARQIAFNRIASKHFDFIVCRASDLSLVCAVELNDKSHSGQRARTRDQFVAQVCHTLGLPLLTVQAQHAYSLQDVQSQFVSVTSPASSPIIASPPP